MEHHQEKEHMHCPRRGERERRREIFEEIMTKNFPNLKQGMNLQIQEAQWTPSRINSKTFTLRQVTLKLLKNKGKEYLESRRENLFITHMTPRSLGDQKALG